MSYLCTVLTLCTAFLSLPSCYNCIIISLLFSFSIIIYISHVLKSKLWFVCWLLLLLLTFSSAKICSKKTTKKKHWKLLAVKNTTFLLLLLTAKNLVHPTSLCPQKTSTPHLIYVINQSLCSWDGRDF